MSGILLLSTEIWCAIIAGAVGIVTTLITAIASFQMSVKKDRDKAKEELKNELHADREKNRAELQVLRDDISSMGANLQQKIAVLEIEQGHTRQDIVILSNHVEKHNGVIERTLKLEESDKLLDERIRVANHRIEDLEHKVG